MKVHGLYRYATDPSTFPLMLAYGNRKVGRLHWQADLDAISAGTQQSVPSDLRAFIEDPRVEFHAHNAAFEIAIWSEICVERWGWPTIELDRWHCTAAKGSSANQPRGLDMLVQRLGLREEFQKDKKGKDLIKALSVPQKAQKVYLKTVLDEEGKPVKDEADPKGRRNKKRVNTKSVQYLNEQGIETFEMPAGKSSADFFFDRNSELLEEFADYNIQDIIAEEAADAKLPPIGEYERKVWLLDRKINQRGIPVDLDLCRGALAIYSEEVEQAHSDICKVTDGAVKKCTQRQKLVEWINQRVNFGDSLRDEYVTEFLEKYEDKKVLWPDLAHPHLDPDKVVQEVIDALNLRQLAGGTAVGKYKAALNYASDDWRVRDQLLYYGAATGRWTGKGIQPHNFKRAATPDETFINALKTGDFSLVSFMTELEGITNFKLLKACLRGIIRAPEGKKLVVSDFAGIESRVLNWLCGNERKLELFRKGEDTYIHAALPIYGVKFEDITEWNEKKQKFVIQKAHEIKRQIGKACELGLGYGMGGTTFHTNALRAGNVIGLDFAAEVVAKWRDDHKEVIEFWYRIEKACKFVIRNKNGRSKPAKVNSLKVYWDPRGYLCIELPSGRVLYYYDAVIDRESGQIFYRDGGKMGKPENKGRINTYGGKLTENIVQAIARDLLVNSLMIIDAAGYDIVFHVHDESVTEVDLEDMTAKKVIHEAMQTLPQWAAGLPLVAETHETIRYTK